MFCAWGSQDEALNGSEPRLVGSFWRFWGLSGHVLFVSRQMFFCIKTCNGNLQATGFAAF